MMTRNDLKRKRQQELKKMMKNLLRKRKRDLLKMMKKKQNLSLRKDGQQKMMTMKNPERRNNYIYDNLNSSL